MKINNDYVTKENGDKSIKRISDSPEAINMVLKSVIDYIM
tara:strand:+ start:2081 stop:2200 length:120 start_codon:yes stop_codon:yes gene_type:complete